MKFALQLLIGGLSAVLALASDRSFFTSVELRDSISNYNYSLDPNHWFLIEAEMFVSEGQTEEITLKIPSDFTALPETPFSLLHHSKEIGKVVNNGDVMTVSFPKVPSSNSTATFNFLTKLNQNALKDFNGPHDVEYVFESSQGDSFKQVMHYKAKSLDEITANGGIYENNRSAWFTVDIPVSQLDHPIHIMSQPKMGSSKYMIDTTQTRCEIVNEVDAFNEPLVSVPLSPLEDESSLSAIDMKFGEVDTLHSKYIRVTYFTLPLNYSPVGSQVSFSKGSASGISKRDSKKNLELNIFGDSHVNLFSRDDASQASVGSKTYSNNTISISKSHRFPSSVLSSPTALSNIMAGISGMSTIPSVTFANSENTMKPSSTTPKNATSSQYTSSSSKISTSGSTIAANMTSPETRNFESYTSNTPANSTSTGLPTKSSHLNADASTVSNFTPSTSATSGFPGTTSSVSNSTLTSKPNSASILPSQTNNSTVDSAHVSVTQSGKVPQNTTMSSRTSSSLISSSVTLSTSNSTIPTTSESFVGSSSSNSTSPTTASISSGEVPSKSLFNTTALRTQLTSSSSILKNFTTPSKSSITPTTSSGSLASSTVISSSPSVGHLTNTTSVPVVNNSSDLSHSFKYSTTPSSSSKSSSNSNFSFSAPSNVSTSSNIVTPYSGNMSSSTFPYETYSVITSTGSKGVTSFESWFPVSTVGTSKNASVTSSSLPFETYGVETSSDSGKIASSTGWFPVATEKPSMNASVTESTFPFKTYSVITSSNNGEIISSTSWFPVATKRPSENASITTRFSPYESYSLITGMQNGELTSFTSWYPIATESLNRNNTVPSITTRFSDEYYSSYTPITTTQSGVVKTYNSWYPLSTGTEESSNGTVDPQTDGYKTYAVVTGTHNGQTTSFTSWFPLSTQGSSENRAGTTGTSTSVSDVYSSCITTTQDGNITSYNTWIPRPTNGASSAVLYPSQFEGTYSALTKDGSNQQTTKTFWYPVGVSHLNSTVNMLGTETLKASPVTQASAYGIITTFATSGISTNTSIGQEYSLSKPFYTWTNSVPTIKATDTLVGQAEQTSEITNGGSIKSASTTDKVNPSLSQGSSFSNKIESLPVQTTENTLPGKSVTHVSFATEGSLDNNPPVVTTYIDSATQPGSTIFRTYNIITSTSNGAETGSNTQPTDATPTITNSPISYGSQETNSFLSTTPSNGSPISTTQISSIYDTTQKVSTATSSEEMAPCSCYQMVETLTRISGDAWSTVGVSQSPIRASSTSYSSTNTETPSGTVAKRDNFATKTSNFSQTMNVQTFEAGATRPQAGLLSSIVCILILLV